MTKIKQSNFIDESALREKELNDRIKYLQADFDNLRKYFDKEKCSIISLSNKDLITSLLEVLDDFDNALKSDSSNGFCMIYDKLIKILSSKGLESIKALGEKFNPEIHEALMKEGDDDVISDVFQKGYMLNKVVIRPAKVKVGGEFDG